MSKRDLVKDSAEGVATTAAAVLASGASGGAALIAAGVPTLSNVLFDAIAIYRKRRTEKWLHYVLSSNDSPEELADRIRAGLMDERETVIQAIIGGAHAAADAVDASAVVAIAALSRAQLCDEIPRWFCRAALEVLTEVSAPELLALRLLCNAVAECDAPFPRLVASPFKEGVVSTVSVDRHPSSGESAEAVPIVDILHAVRVFQVLRRSSIAEDAPSGGFGSMSARNVLVFNRTNARWLATVLLPTSL